MNESIESRGKQNSVTHSSNGGRGADASGGEEFQVFQRTEALGTGTGVANESNCKPKLQAARCTQKQRHTHTVAGYKQARATR